MRSDLQFKSLDSKFGVEITIRAGPADLDSGHRLNRTTPMKSSDLLLLGCQIEKCVSVSPAGKKPRSQWGKAVSPRCVPSQRPSSHRPHLGLPACCPPTHFAACCLGCLAPLLIITPNHRRHLGPLFSCPSAVSFSVSLLACDSVRPGRLTRFVPRLGRSCPFQADIAPSPIVVGLQSVLGGLAA